MSEPPPRARPLATIIRRGLKLLAGLAVAALLLAGFGYLWPNQAISAATWVFIKLVPLQLRLADPTKLNGSTWLEPDLRSAPGVRYQELDSDVAKSKVSFLVYLPPGYDSSDVQTRYPTIYWLYGSGRTPREGADGFVPHIDRLVREGKIPPVIVVMPNLLNDSYFVDSRDGKWPVETMLVKDLVPYVDRTYRTIPDRTARAIDGYSMGGYGSAHLGFKYPALFGVVSISAGPTGTYEDLVRFPSGLAAMTLVFGNDRAYLEANSPLALASANADALRAGTRIQLAYGALDRFLGPDVRQYDQELSRLAVPHRLVVIANADHGTFLSAPDERPYLFYASAFAAGGPAVAPASAAR